MTKKEQLQDHLRSIRYFSSPGMCWDSSKIVSKIQEELDAVKKLLQEPESKSLARSVLRLTRVTNTLKVENIRLKQDLLVTNLKLDVANEKLASREDLDAVTRSNEYLREKNNKLEYVLDMAEQLLQWAPKKKLEPETLAASVLRLTERCNALEKDNSELEEDLKTDEAYVKMLREQIGTLQVTVAKTKALLQERYIELLKRDRSNPL